MNATHAVALLLAVLGPFLLVLGIDLILGIARRNESAASENPPAERD